MKLSFVPAFALAVFVLAVAGPAAAVSRDACPVAAAGATSGALSAAVPAGAVLVGPSSARLEASILGASDQATSLVEYGPSADYGLCTAASPVAAGGTGLPLETVLTGLTPQTTYHFAVVVTDGTDTATSGDQTFTTLPAGLIPQGATINGVAVGGLAEPEALRVLRQHAAAPVRLAFGGRQWSASRTALGARVDADRVTRALQALPGQALTVPLSLDTRRLTAYLATANRRYGQPARQAVVRLLGRHAVVSRARAGVRIDTGRARAAVTAYLLQGRSGALRLAQRRTAAPAPRNQKAVVVRLGTQTLTAYLDGRPVLTTPVTTGRPALPTPVGSFYIHSRFSPYTFISPWPKGNPYWYPPTPVTWAMYFYDNDFLHDDPGEPASAFGAGSQNGPYASHGCVHVPHDAMSFLYDWLPVGATVIVAQS